MDTDTTTVDRPPVTPPPTGPWRVMGCDRYTPGTAVWLAADGFTTTRQAHQAREWDDYSAAERTAARMHGDVAAGLGHWMPVPASVDLPDLQARDRRPWRQADSSDHRPPPSATPRRYR